MEVAISTEINYRENCVQKFEWRVRRKATLEEDARNRELQIEREEQEHRERVEQASIASSMKPLRCDERWMSALMLMP